MKTISIAEFKAQATRVMRRVESGETYTVTRRNKPIGRVVGVSTPRKNRTQAGFDPLVQINCDLSAPVLDASEWGDLSSE